MNDETIELSENYKKEAAKLVELTDKREEMKSLLKLATADKVDGVKQAIAQLDNLIEQTENILDLEYRRCVLLKEQADQYKKLDEMCDLIEPELIKYVAETNPEKLPELMEMLPGKKSH